MGVERRGPTGETVPGAVRRQAEWRGDADALVMDGRAVTFADLDRSANRVANALLAHGLVPGGRFAVVDKNSLAFFPLVVGGLRAGGTHLAVNWRLTPPEMRVVLGRSRAQVVFAGADTVDQVADAVADLDDPPAVVVLADAASGPGRPALDDWLAPHGDGDPGVAVSAADTAFLFSTSGTTGVPKGVPVSHDACLTQVRGLGPLLGFRAGAVSLMAMPTFHIAGTEWTLQGLYHGATTVVLREFDPGAVLAAIQEHRVTHAMLVPAMLTFLLEDPALAGTDTSAVETVSYGGSPIAPSTLSAAVDALGCRFFQTYGITEVAGAVSVLHADDHDPARPELLASAGRPVPWCDVRICDPDTGAFLPVGSVGEVCVRSPANMPGYDGVPNEESGAFFGEWLRTGDAGYVDADGYLFLHDRVRDMVVTGGENVYPVEVENVLAAHPEVVEVAVIGVPSDRWGEAVHAVAVRVPGGTVTAEELVAFARPQLAGFKLPKSVAFVDRLPRNPSGKVLKTELRRPYWAERARAVG
ncbi:MAG TPA: long-chain-fatty-acid--CoA ligase [Acidimicrobiales bacterium]|nr:long-chain-fatty-acid--CoA ligase [Acidimicrobiales bacterium]